MENPDKPESPTGGEIQDRVTHLEHSERHLEHRLAALDKSVSEMRNVNLEGHKWHMTFLVSLMTIIGTLIFAGVGVFLTITANQNRDELRQDLKDMQDKVDASVQQMNDNFSKLAGNALKKPVLTISNDHGDLSGQSLAVVNRELPLMPLYVRNIGDKETSPLIVQIYTSQNLNVQGMGALSQTYCNDKNYPYCYHFEIEQVIVYPQETTALTPNSDYPDLAIMPTMFPINCKLLIFYGAEKPAEADFQLKPR